MEISPCQGGGRMDYDLKLLYSKKMSASRDSWGLGEEALLLN